ncbi:MAG: ATP-dependent helicase [Candidatus Saganbacteria bacterium]|nr:ATP-dependent helicase [Candidatus Saganbacteria bacterium]
MPAIKTHADVKDILKGLNPEQIKAVTHGQGPMLAIAGAGTGKTTVIIRRIAYLIATKKAKPGEILALTFTDKAAEEMEARVDKLVPYGYIDVSLATFHAFGDRVLRDHCLELGLDPDYRVMSRPEQLVFFREHLFDLPLKYYKTLSDPTKHLDALINVISRAQDENISPEAFLKWAKKLKVAGSQESVAREEKRRYLEIAAVYQKYQQLKAEKGFIDFGDQVSLALKLFRERPAVLKEFQQRYKYILVDEFQDTNLAQFELLKLLAGKKANLTVVGDDDQSIYKFRGAAISNILGFKKVYKKTKTIVLTKNYRSSQIILDTAHRLIKHNDPDRLEVRAGIDKRLVSCVEPATEPRCGNRGRRRGSTGRGREEPTRSAAGGTRPQHLHFDRLSSEADWVAQTIKSKHEKGYKYSDFAILVRANADAEIFRQSLNMQNIPHQFFGGAGLYQYPEVQLALSFLKSVGDLADSPALFQLSVSPVYQLDPLDLQKMNTFAQRRNLTLHHVFSHLEDKTEDFSVLSDLKKKSRSTVRRIMDDIEHYLAFAREKTTGEVLHRFLKRSGYLEKLMKDESEENDRRLQNLARFFDILHQFKSVAELDRVSEFIKYINVMRQAGDNPESVAFDPDLDAVQVMTVHKAKGLEFREVFLVSLVAEKFPSRRRKDPIELPPGLIKEELPSGDFHLQEERRLFYVGMTRAKEALYLTSSADLGGKRQRKVSQFVLEALDTLKADISMIKRSAKEQIELFAPIEVILPAAKKIRSGEPIYLSASQIEDYLLCPLKYKYVSVLRVPLLPNHQIIYGVAMHQAAQALSSARKNKKKFTEKQLIETLLRNWSSEGFISREHEEQRLSQAKKALKRFFRDEQRSKRRIKYVEEEFSVPKGDIIVRGRWDRVEELGGKTYITDFKTSEIREQEDADKRAKESKQLNLYAAVWQEKFKDLPYRVELYFMDSGLVGSVEKDQADVLKTWQMVKDVAQGIRSGKFTAKPNYRSCSYCAYNEICPAAAV